MSRAELNCPWTRSNTETPGRRGRPEARGQPIPLLRTRAGYRARPVGSPPRGQEGFRVPDRMRSVRRPVRSRWRQAVLRCPCAEPLHLASGSKGGCKRSARPERPRAANAKESSAEFAVAPPDRTTRDGLLRDGIRLPAAFHLRATTGVRLPRLPGRDRSAL